jgi:arylformamidase
MGDKSQLYGFLATFYAKQGIGVVVTNYRLSPEVQHPEHIKDVARAFAWTHKNIGKHGGDPGRIFICGHSAGGHLVALLATNGDYLKAEGLTVADIKGCIPISGIFDIRDKMMPRVFGPDGANRKTASPLYNVKDGLPPFLVLCADKDIVNCRRPFAEAFVTALTKKSNKAELVEVKDSDHLRILFSAAGADTPVSKAILTFIEANGKK